jgi:hypothetical protein
MAYARSIVIPNDTLSPDSTGSINTMGFIKANNIVGKITVTMLYNGRRLIESSRTNVRDISTNYYYRQDINGVSSCMKRLLLYYHRNDKANYVKDGLCITSKNFRFSRDAQYYC